MPGISLLAFERLSEQGLYSGDFNQDLTDIHQGYQHTISAVGGYDTASFSIRGRPEDLQDWIDDGLMRRIVLYDPEGIIAWEGFVARMQYTYGPRRETRAVEGMYNRIYLHYSPLDFSVFPPIEGTPRTIIVDDTASQFKWGIKSAVINGGGRVDRTAFDWARTVLKFSKDPQSGEDNTTSGGGDPEIRIDCLGYYHTLKWIPYINNVAGRIRAHEVIQEVLANFNTVNPGWLSQDFGWMDFNLRFNKRGYDSLASCWDVIAEIIAEGGNGGERWVGGIYQDRRFIYKEAEDFAGLYSDHFEVLRSLQDGSLFFFDEATGSEIKPWNMVPDRILRTVDEPGPQQQRYIEQVNYLSPYTVDIIGGDDQRLAVFLAQRGLSTV
ncbi:MAG: hypothetical protein ACYTEQ_09390 [Planctomycetota bacterium]|jgi:hypothetical protein